MRIANGVEDGVGRPDQIASGKWSSSIGREDISLRCGHAEIETGHGDANRRSSASDLPSALSGILVIAADLPGVRSSVLLKANWFFPPSQSLTAGKAVRILLRAGIDRLPLGNC